MGDRLRDNGFGTFDVVRYGYGGAESKPLPADFDGDGIFRAGDARAHHQLALDMDWVVTAGQQIFLLLETLMGTDVRIYQ